ncbi:hypothetical protein, partial [Frankia sp. Cj3]|uniref:hypothetical protein n=1 Tax=Frankia sp. Cj3 TaxID=2880976 RepID=UPI001EF4F7B4
VGGRRRTGWWARLDVTWSGHRVRTSAPAVTWCRFTVMYVVQLSVGAARRARTHSLPPTS